MYIPIIARLGSLFSLESNEEDSLLSEGLVYIFIFLSYHIQFSSSWDFFPTPFSFLSFSFFLLSWVVSFFSPFTPLPTYQ